MPELPDLGGDLPSGLFARGEIYALGQLPVAQEDDWAVVHLPTPKNFVTGFVPRDAAETYFSPLRSFAFLDSKLIYVASTIDWDGTARTFVVDGSGTGELTEPYPAAPAENDPVVRTPQCPNDVQGVVTSPSGRLIYRCGPVEWYEGNELVLTKPDVFLLTDEGSAMYADALPMNIAELGGPDDFPVEISFLGAARVVGNKFHAAVLRNDGAYELVEIKADASYKSLGIYPAGSDRAVVSGVLDEQDRLYQLGGPGRVTPFEGKRFTVNGKVEVYLARGKSAIEPAVLMAP
jgi:hypothetical protein